MPKQRGELESWTQSRSLPAGDVYRARLILALADGLSYREIERKLGASRPTVSKWKRRFEQDGTEGLQGRQQGSKLRWATPGMQARGDSASTTEALCWQHPLVLPQTVGEVRRQQVDGAANSGAGQVATASVGPLHDRQRP
ncbi:MAG: helix-turn-helix domain-containing protein [Acidobacteriaceae bacterium]|nr:helix-turn-helix domain-containing protein [Acidobacteriaceae bacterium]